MNAIWAYKCGVYRDKAKFYTLTPSKFISLSLCRCERKVNQKPRWTSPRCQMIRNWTYAGNIIWVSERENRECLSLSPSDIVNSWKSRCRLLKYIKSLFSNFKVYKTLYNHSECCTSSNWHRLTAEVFFLLQTLIYFVTLLSW